MPTIYKITYKYQHSIKNPVGLFSYGIMCSYKFFNKLANTLSNHSFKSVFGKDTGVPGGGVYYVCIMNSDYCNRYSISGTRVKPLDETSASFMVVEHRLLNPPLNGRSSPVTYTVVFQLVYRLFSYYRIYYIHFISKMIIHFILLLLMYG